MASKTTILVLALGLFLGYLFYTPIPEDMVDTLQYRFLTAGLKTANLVATIRTFFHPGDDIYYQTFSYVSDLVLPAADKKVPGSNVQVHYTQFDGVRVLLYEPLTKKEGLAPGLVYFHGGGYAFGSTKSHSPLTRKLAEELDMVVASVDYRLAPANPFPAGFEDCFAATKWFLNHASDFGVDPTRVVVSGDSAGGHLSAIISQHVHDDPTLPNIKLQVLIYPWIQMFDMNTPSYRNYQDKLGDTGIVSKPSAARFLSVLVFGKLDQNFIQHVQVNAQTSNDFKQNALFKKRLNHNIIYEKLNIAAPDSEEGAAFESNATLWAEVKDKLMDPRMSPLFREDLKGLPTAFIITADLDSIRDDGIFYAKALEEAGVEVTLKNYLGAYHAIVAAGPVKDIPTGVKIVNDMIEFIKTNI